MENKDKNNLNIGNQHSIINSILLHLIQGLFILGGIFLFSQPIFCDIFGIDTRLGPVLGFLMAILFGLIPVQLGILFYVSKKQNNTFNLKGVINYTEKSPTKQYLVYIPILLFFSVFLFMVLAPIFNAFFIDTLFWWYPQEYNFQDVMQDPAQLKDYKGDFVLLILYVILAAILGPLVKELYFRGYLLPRMEENIGKGAPFASAILFSLYHFFSPLENLIRIIGLIPIVYIVWRKKDIRFGILTHILLNTSGAILMILTIYLA